MLAARSAGSSPGMPFPITAAIAVTGTYSRTVMPTAGTCWRGLIRSLGGWSAVKSIRCSGVEEKGDARILGASEFVNQVIDEAEQQVKHQLAGKDLIGAARDIIRSDCRDHHVSTKLLRSGNRRQAVSNLRKQLTLKLVNELGLSLAETGRQLGLTTSGVAQILRRNQ